MVTDNTSKFQQDMHKELTELQAANTCTHWPLNDDMTLYVVEKLLFPDISNFVCATKTLSHYGKLVGVDNARSEAIAFLESWSLYPTQYAPRGPNWYWAMAQEGYLSDVKIMELAVQKHEKVLQYASTCIRDNLCVAMAAVKRRPRALQYVSPALKNHTLVVACAVKGNGLALQYASSVLRDDIDTVTIAVKQNPYAFQYASSSMLCNKDVLLKFVEVNDLVLKFASREFLKDRDVVVAALQGQVLGFI